MKINVLCIGDIVGRPGRRIVADKLKHIVKEHGIDCVIANAENAAGGSGLTRQIYDKLLRYGVNLITLGDHTYRKREIIPTLENADNILDHPVLLKDFDEMHFSLCALDAYAANLGVEDPFDERVDLGNKFKSPAEPGGERIVMEETYLKENYPVISSVPMEHGYQLRVVAEDITGRAAEPAAPNLEDAYICFMQSIGYGMDLESGNGEW